MAHLGEQGKMPRLERCGPWGRQDSGPAYYNDDELLCVAKRLRNWLAKDAKMTDAKFNVGELYDNYLKSASCLDPRFKALLFLTPEERDATDKTVLT